MEGRLPFGNQFAFRVRNVPEGALARDLDLKESDFAGDGLDPILAFYARAGRVMNERGDTPLVYLRKLVGTNATARAYIDDLRTRVRAHGLVLKWQDSEVEVSEHTESGEINILVTRLTQGLPLPSTLLTIEHELAHRKNNWALADRNVTIHQFVDLHYGPFLREELRVRRSERQARDRIRAAGIAVPARSVSDLTLKVLKAEDRGADETSLFKMVEHEYGHYTTVGLAKTWAGLYQKSDAAELVKIAGLMSETEFKDSWRTLAVASLRYQTLAPDQRATYWKTIAETALTGETSPLVTARLTRLLSTGANVE